MDKAILAKWKMGKEYDASPPKKWLKACALCDSHDYIQNPYLVIPSTLAICNNVKSPSLGNVVVGSWGCIYSSALNLEQLLCDESLAPYILMPDGTMLKDYRDLGMPDGITIGEAIRKVADG